jgi:hypothetical protein
MLRRSYVQEIYFADLNRDVQSTSVAQCYYVKDKPNIYPLLNKSMPQGSWIV